MCDRMGCAWSRIDTCAELENAVAMNFESWHQKHTVYGLLTGGCDLLCHLVVVGDKAFGIVFDGRGVGKAA
jgi:hypothetical protein